MTVDLRQGDCLEVMRSIDDNSVDLTVTSPPYDNLRTYNDSLEWGEHVWKPVIKELYRVTAEGGVVVWIVADATVKGSETGTSFRQALHGIDSGFLLNDTMIWNKLSPPTVGAYRRRYMQVFEYMFIWTKGAPKTFNAIKDRKNKSAGMLKHGTVRHASGEMKPVSGKGNIFSEYGNRFNIWNIPPCLSNKERTGHPAQMSLALAKDHVQSWSKEGDTVLDPFMGSGTTGVACELMGRNFIGIEKDAGYFKQAKDRIESATSQLEIAV